MASLNGLNIIARDEEDEDEKLEKDDGDGLFLWKNAVFVLKVANEGGDLFGVFENDEP